MENYFAHPIGYLPLTLDEPAANLALDQALLEQVEQTPSQPGCLRIWEPREHFVVLGRSSDATREVCLAACQEAGVGVWRRPSGGGVVLLGPGCLMYTLVLRRRQIDDLAPIDLVHRLVLERHAAALRPLEPSVRRDGISDLTVQGRTAADRNARQKFSGNSLRLKRQTVLYHGALLYDFDLAQIQRLLAWPRRMPDYRQQRSHRDFVTNFPATREQLSAALVDAWQASPRQEDWPQQRTASLLASDYRSVSPP